MTTLEQTELGIDFTTGRYDIKIPIPKPPGSFDGGNMVLEFFRNFWELNGFDPATNQHYSLGGKPIAFSHELVLPADSYKPLVVIRGSNVPVSEEAIQFQKWSDERHRTRRPQPITRAVEQHQILVPPRSLGGFVLALGVKYVDKSGELNISHDPFEVHENDKYLSVFEFEPEYDNYPSDFNVIKEGKEKAKNDYRQAVFASIQKAVDLLSIKSHAD